jgi:hypothetical protein
LQMQKPQGHGNAWALTGEHNGVYDTQNKKVSWKEIANRALAHYSRTEITREEEFEAYRFLMHPIE